MPGAGNSFASLYQFTILYTPGCPRTFDKGLRGQCGTSTQQQSYKFSQPFFGAARKIGSFQRSLYADETVKPIIAIIILMSCGCVHTWADKPVEHKAYIQRDKSFNQTIDLSIKEQEQIDRLHKMYGYQVR